jgi:hypothetical protein
MAMNHDVIRVINILEFRRAPVKIKKRHLIDWFSSDDPNVIAAAVDAVLMHSDWISPRLTNADILELLQKNLALNLFTRKAPTPYGHSCYEAGRALFMWVTQVAVAGGTHPELLPRLSSFLSGLYLSAPDEQRNCIINGVLEHLFESDVIRQHFEHWQDEDALREAFINARRWSDWASVTRTSLEEVAEKTADLLRASGHHDAFVTQAGPATVVPTISLHDRVVMMSCDSAWVELFRRGALNLESAAKYAADQQNWRTVAEGGITDAVELFGNAFEKRTS